MDFVVNLDNIFNTKFFVKIANIVDRLPHREPPLRAHIYTKINKGMLRKEIFFILVNHKIQK